MMKKLTWCIAGIAVAAFMGTVQAATLTYSSSIPDTQMDWTDSTLKTLSVQKFDTSLGTLNAVTLTLNGHVLGTIKFENLDAAAQTVTGTLRADMTLSGLPDAGIMELLSVKASRSDALSSYDGTTDYSGTSGKTYTNVLGSNKSTSTTYTNLSDLNLFTGSGTKDFTLEAISSSYASGSGNVASQFTTYGAASLTAVYDYTVVPEPTAALLFILGGAGVLLRRRK